MADRLLSDCGSGGFYLDDHEALLEAMRRDPKPKILLGVSYALWDLAERYAPKLDDTIVMETGGMKGYREEIPKAEFHKILCDAFGVDRIHSEYGFMVVVRLHPDPGRGARGPRRCVRGRRAHRPQRHQGLQPAGAVAERQRHHTVPVRRLPHTGYDP